MVSKQGFLYHGILFGENVWKQYACCKSQGFSSMAETYMKIKKMYGFNLKSKGLFGYIRVVRGWQPLRRSANKNRPIPRFQLPKGECMKLMRCQKMLALFHSLGAWGCKSTPLVTGFCPQVFLFVNKFSYPPSFPLFDCHIYYFFPFVLMSFSRSGIFNRWFVVYGSKIHSSVVLRQKVTKYQDYD